MPGPVAHQTAEVAERPARIHGFRVGAKGNAEHVHPFPIEEVTMSTVYETTVDTLREVGERLAHEMPSSLPSVRVPSVRIPSSVSDVMNDWPDDLVDRVTGRRRTRWQTPVFVAGGVVAAMLAVAWFVRRRRSAEAESTLSVADEARAAGAA
jgi:hypothetical protein